MKKLITMLVTAFICLSSFGADITGGTKFYFTPSSTWDDGYARFAAYFFNNSEGTEIWCNLNETAISVLYEVTVPHGTWEGVIFCRMDINASDNDWVNKWQQTSNQTPTEIGTNNHCKITGWNESGDNPCEWVTYPNITWIGNSYIVFNNEWHKGMGKDDDDTNPKFDTKNFDKITTNIKLGGQVQAYSPAIEDIVMGYKITQGSGDSKTTFGEEKFLDLPVVGMDGNNSLHQAIDDNSAVVSVADLNPGTYNLEVWFNYDNGSDGIWDSNGGGNYIATFTIPDLNLRNSFIYIGDGPGEGEADWYNASGASDSGLDDFDGSNLNTVTSPFKLGGEIITVKRDDIKVFVNYKILQGSGEDQVEKASGAIEIASKESINSDADYQWKSEEGTNIFAGLSLDQGNYKLAVWFSVTAGDITQYHSNDSQDYIADFNLSTALGVTSPKTTYTIFTDNNQISASFEGAKQVQLYSVVGQLLYAATVESQFVYPVQAGVYLLCIDNETFKLLVK